MTHRFDPAHMDRLLEPDRQLWNDPNKIISHLPLNTAGGVGDIGCGPGFFTLGLAKQAPQATIFAVDISPEMLDRLKERVLAAGLTNIEPVLMPGIDEIPIHSSICDALLLANVYHEVDPASNIIHELRRLLKPGGILLLLDWRKETTPFGPPVHHRLEPQDIIAEFTAGGFTFVGNVDVGPYHYGLKFLRPATTIPDREGN